MNGLAADVIRSVDPVALAADLGLDLDPWQREVVRARGDVLVNGARQTGKSTVAGLVAVHEAIFRPRSLTLLVAPAHRQSIETFHTTLGLYKDLGRPVSAETENTMALTMENGSRILAVPGREQTVRGYGAVDLIVVDEAARVPDELIHSIRPMLAVSDGRIIAISTPNGRRGWWYEAWSRGSGWEKHLVRASDCPRISPGFLEERRREMPGWWFAQEFEGAFTDTDRAAFLGEDIEAAFGQEVVAWSLFS